MIPFLSVIAVVVGGLVLTIVAAQFLAGLFDR